MSDEAKAAWFLDADFTPTSTLVERLRKPERVVVNEAGFTMLFSSSDKLNAADRIEKLEVALQEIAKLNNRRDRFSSEIDAVILKALDDAP